MDSYTNMVAVPRLHGEFLEEENCGCIKSKVKVLDPTCQNEGAFSVSPAWHWDKAHALQCLNDFRQNTSELARDKNGARLDFLQYQEQMKAKYNFQLSADEITDLQKFAGQEIPLEQKDNIPELAQLMLILAYHNENLYQELEAVQKTFYRQQQNLQALLDDDNEYTEVLPANDDTLLPWQQVFSAFMVYTQEADAYYINDRSMAQAVMQKGKAENKDGYTFVRLAKESLLPMVLPVFQPCCTKNEYMFIIKE